MGKYNVLLQVVGSLKKDIEENRDFFSWKNGIMVIAGSTIPSGVNVFEQAAGLFNGDGNHVDDGLYLGDDKIIAKTNTSPLVLFAQNREGLRELASLLEEKVRAAETRT